MHRHRREPRMLPLQRRLLLLLLVRLSLLLHWLLGEVLPTIRNALCCGAGRSGHDSYVVQRADHWVALVNTMSPAATCVRRPVTCVCTMVLFITGDAPACRSGAGC